MSSIPEILEKIFTLTSNVETLVKDVERLNQMLLSHQERIVMLEGRDELTAEKAKSAALAAVLQTNNNLHEKIAELQKSIQIMQGVEKIADFKDKK